jgi:hypothetical protein
MTLENLKIIIRTFHTTLTLLNVLNFILGRSVTEP